VKLSNAEIDFLIVVDTSPAGSLYVGESLSQSEVVIYKKMLEKGLIQEDDNDSDSVVLTEMGRDVLAANE
jgi:hypothetical protein